MKKVLSIILSFCMLLSFVPLTALADDGWTMHADAYVNGHMVDPSEPVILYKGAKLFVCFDTPAENVDHGLAPFVGFSDNYEGGTLSSAGFKVTGGTASDFGLDAADWGFGSDPTGSLIEAGDLAPGTVGHLDYFLYECENFDWANFGSFDFVNTPRTLIQTLTFIVGDYGFTATETSYPEYGNTSPLKLAEFGFVKSAEHQNPLDIMVYPSEATFVNVNDAADTHTVDLYASITDDPYILYNGESYLYNETEHSNRPITDVAGEHEFIYVDSTGNEADFAALADKINGRVVICNRGALSFYEKCNNAAKYGAAAIIVANNQEGEFGMNLNGYNYTVPAVAISKAFADRIKATADCTEGSTPYYTGSLTISDKNTTIQRRYPAEYYCSLDRFEEPVGIFAEIDDWSEFKPDAVYKAVITYKTDNYDRYGSNVFSLNMPNTTEIIIHNHKSDGGKVTKKATTTEEGVKTYKCTVCGKVLKTDKIAKLPKKKNTLKAKGKAVTVKAGKKSTIKKAKAFTIKAAKGKVTFKKSSGSKYVTVAKNGKITVKKGLIKDKTYKIKIKVTAAGNNEYKPITKTVTVKIKVR